MNPAPRRSQDSFYLRSMVGASLALTCLLVLLIASSRLLMPANSGEIAFESDTNGNWDIYLLDLHTGSTVNLTRNPADDLTPAWSPDGKTLLFNADRDGSGQPELYRMNADGSGVERVSTGSGSYRSARWSPDGSAIIYVYEFGQIQQMKPDGSDEQWIAYGFAPSISPDGRWIVYSADTRGDITGEIYRYDLQDHKISNLTTNRVNDWGAVWSPDGTQIAFLSARGSRAEIYLMNVDGTDLHAITGSAVDDLTPAWSPDGTQIVYASGVTGNMQLYVVNRDGSNPHAITAIPGTNHAPAWRPLQGGNELPTLLE